MVIENIMFFVLGVLLAGLVALMVMPAIWRRAVRLTKKRIEAATPMSMAEFRADKDQLRAEFALSTRRLEMNVEALRKRLAEQLREINRKKSDLASVKADRDNHLTIVRELEEREGELRRRVLELEKESAELNTKLRLRDREYADKVAQLEGARESLRGSGKRQHQPAEFDGNPLTGDYDADVAHLARIVEIERKRISFLETQTAGLLDRLEVAGKQAEASGATIEGLRRSTAAREDSEDDTQDDLISAEARLAQAESRLNQLLTETEKVVAVEEGKTEQLLAEKLSLEAELTALRSKVENVELTLMADWDSERIEHAHLRERLNDIASEVARLVYSADGRDDAADGESLYDRVQRFADDGLKIEELSVRPAAGKPAPARSASAGTVSDRLAALREIRGDS